VKKKHPFQFCVSFILFKTTRSVCREYNTFGAADFVGNTFGAGPCGASHEVAGAFGANNIKNYTMFIIFKQV
jgi:hypothetical protein